MSSDYLSSLSPSDSGFFSAFTNVPPAHVPRTRNEPNEDQQAADQETSKGKRHFDEALEASAAASHRVLGDPAEHDAGTENNDESGILDTDRLIRDVELPESFVERLQRLF